MPYCTRCATSAGKFQPVGTPTVGTLFVFRTVFGHENQGGEVCQKPDAAPHQTVRRDPEMPRTGNRRRQYGRFDHIRVRNRLRGMALSLLTTRRTFTLLPWCLGPSKTIHPSREGDCCSTVLIQLGFDLGNLSLQMSILVTEFRDEALLFRNEAFEIIDDCKKIQSATVY